MMENYRNKRVYVPQKVYKILLDKSVIYCKNDDLFVMDGFYFFADFCTALGLSSQLVCPIEDVTRDNITTYKYIFTTNLEKLSKELMKNRNVHYLSLVQRDDLVVFSSLSMRAMEENRTFFEWRGSEGTVDNLKGHFLSNSYDTVDLNEIPNYFLCNTVAFCAEAGMGKSYALNSLSKHLDVPVIDLRSKSNHLESLERELKHYKHPTVLLDGFEQTYNQDKLFMILEKLSNIRVFITSRNCSKICLENRFQTISVSLKGFDETDQRTYSQNYSLEFSKLYEIPLQMEMALTIQEKYGVRAFSIIELYDNYLKHKVMNNENSALKTGDLREEYLIAKSLVNQSNLGTLSKLVKTMLSQKKFANILKFFDMIASEKFSVHQKIVSGDFMDINNAELSARDKFGRTPLHLLVAYCEEDDMTYGAYSKRLSLIKDLCNKSNVLVKDLFGLSPYDVAKEVGSYGARAIIANVLDQRENDKWFSYYSTRFNLNVCNMECKFSNGRIRIHVATEFDQLNLVQHVQRGGNVEAVDDVGRTPIFIAAERGFLSIVECLWKHGSRVNTTTINGTTPLMTASRYGHVNVVAWLLKNGANLHSVDNDGESALTQAAYNGHLRVCEILLTNGAEVNATTKDGWTALMFASLRGFVDVCLLLLKYEADVLTVEKSGGTALMLAAQNGHIDIVQELLNLGADINSVNQFNASVLYKTAENGQSDMIEFLIKRGAMVNMAENDGISPLMAATKHLTAVKALIRNGAYINQKDRNNWDALMYAATAGNVEVVEFLLKNGADIQTIADTNNWTALMMAASKGYLEVIKILLKVGANVNSKHEKYLSVLYRAADDGHFNVVDYLLKNGADLNTEYLGGTYVFLQVAKLAHLDILKLFLIIKPSLIDCTNNVGETALHLAAKDGHFSIVEFLLKSGADFSKTDVNGFDPLLIALRENKMNVVDLLIRHGAVVTCNDQTYSICESAFVNATISGFMDIVHCLTKAGVKPI